ncbi:PrgI family protein [Candidatus Uhrbacteria bacterium]|nr:PrgI family protein [Candidatus Uhrbacteria bacterium]
MEQVTVPQFIENEDKIMGPITVRQFAIVFVDALLIFVTYKMFPLALFIPIAIVLALVGGILGFLKINGQAFHFFILNVTRAVMHPPLMVWRKEFNIARMEEETSEKKEKIEELKHQRISDQRMSELLLVVDTGGIYQGARADDEGTELF